jgi:cell division protein FtsQ
MFKLGKNGQANRKSSVDKTVRLEWHKSYRWLLLIPVLLPAIFYLYQLDQFLPIKTIKVAASFENLDQREVETTLQKYIGEGFFSLDIQQVQESLRQKPWTESVSVRRIWPDSIKVIIVEKKPLARWDRKHLLSDKAVVYLAATGEFSHLPLVHAVNHQPKWVLNQFHRLEQRLSQVDERLVSIKVDSRGALDLVLLNGLLIKLGRADIDYKIERLIAIYNDQILPRREQIQRLDLRYSNGFAVAWKKEVLQGRDKASIWSNSNV